MKIRIVIKDATTINRPFDMSVPDAECCTCEIPPCYGACENCRIFRMVRKTGAWYCGITHQCKHYGRKEDKWT